MSTEYFILDEPLPLAQDFQQLKDIGVKFIHADIGNEWTNLNASDPGATILDQVCYALTELGYCNAFPVRDILTKPNGKLQIEDEFYLPEDILTTSPVTVYDYIKFIIDEVDEIDNVVILDSNNYPDYQGAGSCEIFLLINSSVDPSTYDDVCQSVFFALNKARNIGEQFQIPQPLTENTYKLNGTIEIENASELTRTLSLIDAAIRNYIFPQVLPERYSQLVQDGIATNKIFDGPHLQNGWIPTSALGENKTEIGTFEIQKVIQKVNGVKSVSGLSFTAVSNTSISETSGSTAPTTSDTVSTSETSTSINSDSTVLTEINSQVNEVIVIDIFDSYSNLNLVVICNQENIKPDTKLNSNSSAAKFSVFEENILPGDGVDIYTGLPEGKFRDINSYFSIQNTFPEIFPVGRNAILSNASEFQISQSRQLIGYLTLFDQMIANQFSQLANVPQLFSFKNSVSGTPSDRKNYFAYKTDYEKKNQEFPVPYVRFSPTYFYQSLYNVHNIRPLLKDNDTFKFTIEIEPEKTLERKSWDKYKLDPYNPYMIGLMEFMEDEKTSFARRNDMLDHLLARHGESPILLNAIIDGSIYSGEKSKDRIILKSMYLQNLGLLSYFRYKGYNYLGADSLGNYSDDKIPAELRDPGNYFEQRIFGDDTTDFIFNTRKVNWIEKLTERDFINYSAVELKLCLLFGLKVLYKNFLAHYFIEKENQKENPAEPIEILPSIDVLNQALWFIEKRRGFILLEKQLLLQSLDFNIYLFSTVNQSTLIYTLTQTCKYAATMEIYFYLNSQNENELSTITNNLSFSLNNATYTLVPAKTGTFNADELQNISGTTSSLAISVVSTTGQSQFIEFSNFNSSVELLFPYFIPEFSLPEFSNRLNLFLENAMPVNITSQMHLIPENQIVPLIDAYINWHESMRYKEPDVKNDLTNKTNIPSNEVSDYAWELFNIINQFYITEANTNA